MDIPGFYFDAEKNRYFPNHMKKVLLKPEIKEFTPSLPSQSYHGNYHSRSTMSVSFDRFSERISRFTVKELQWPDQVAFIKGSTDYFRWSWRDCRCVIECVTKDGACIDEIFSYNNGVPLTMGTFSKYLYIILDDGSDIDFPYRTIDIFDLTTLCKVHQDLIAFYSISDAVIEKEEDGSILYFSPVISDNKNIDKNKNKNLIFIKSFPLSHDEKVNNSRVPCDNNVTSFKYNLDINDVLVSLTGGKMVSINSGNVFKLEKSSAKWIFNLPIQNRILLLTFHGDFVCLDVESGKSDTLFNLADISNEMKIEDLLFAETEKNDMLFLTWKDSRKIIVFNLFNLSEAPKMLNTTNPIRQIRYDKSDPFTIYTRFAR